MTASSIVGTIQLLLLLLTFSAEKYKHTTSQEEEEMRPDDVATTCSEITTVKPTFVSHSLQWNDYIAMLSTR